MKRKLIFALSLFGLAMAVASLFGLGTLEPVLWLIIFIVYAWLIARRARGNYFLHGLLVSVANSIWITAIRLRPLILVRSTTQSLCKAHLRR